MPKLFGFFYGLGRTHLGAAIRRNPRGRRCFAGQRSAVERLEHRLPMAVDVFVPPSVGGQENWVTVLADDGSDVYVQQIANSTRDLYVADNAAFRNRAAEIPNFQSQYDLLRVAEGSVLRRATVPFDGYPFVPNPLSPSEVDTTYLFALPLENQSLFGDYRIDSGVLKFTNPVGADSRVSFALNEWNPADRSLFSFTSPELGPIAGTIRLRDGAGAAQGFVELYLQSSRFSSQPAGSVMLEAVSVSRVGTTSTISAEFINLPASSPSGRDSEFQIFSAGQYVAGSLRGTVRIEAFGESRDVPFQVNTTAVGEAIPLSFGTERANETSLQFRSINTDFGFSDGHRLAIRGTFDSTTGLVTLQHEYRDNVNFLEFSSVPVGTKLVDVRVGLSEGYVAGSPSQPTSFTLLAGHDFSTGLDVELSSPGARIAIDSRVDSVRSPQGGSARGTVSLAASTVSINAPVHAATSFIIPLASDTDFNTTTEEVVVNAITTSASVAIHVADNVATPLITRSQLRVAQSGGLSNVNAGLADEIFLEVTDGDAFLEGVISAKSHTYIMSSDQGSETEASYVLTTASPLTQANVGRIVGDTVSITLGNDTLGEFYDSIAQSKVSLQTSIDRLRVRAGSRAGDPLDYPFPYELRIDESDGLIVDAVAASSAPIDIRAGDQLNVLAAIQSMSDVTLRAGDAFAVRAPITTAFGKVDIAAPSVTVDSSVRILDTIQDEREVDIRIEATNGSLRVSDVVAGLNRVQLVSGGGGAGITGAARVFGDVLEIISNGDVSLRTDGNLIRVDAAGSTRLDELNSAAFEVRTSPFVTLIANGRDILLDSDGNTATGTGGKESLSPALFADIFDTQQLVVSAPNGSIDVLHTGANKLAIGHLPSIIAGTADRMVAAGSVVIKSTLAEDVTVYDAASAGSGAEEVRFATSVALPPELVGGQTRGLGTRFMPGGAPGVYRDFLETTITYDPTTKEIAGLDGARVSDHDGVRGLRVGDRILVKDGIANAPGSSKVNGIYVVSGITLGNDGTTPFARILMGRANNADTTQELGEKRYLRVIEGKAFGGRLLTSDGFSIGDGETPRPSLVVSDILPRPGFLPVTAMANGPLVNVTYDSSSRKIRATSPGPIANDAALFDGVVLGQGSLVLVRQGVRTTAEGGAPQEIPESVGLYVVGNAGGNSEWELVPYEGADEDGDGVKDLWFEGVVAVNEGSMRSSRTGFMYQLSYDAINTSGVEYRMLENYRNRLDFNTATGAIEVPVFEAWREYKTDIGSSNPNGLVDFRVSTSGGMNTATGSLGRMLTLAQENSAIVERLRRPQAFAFHVGTNVRSIVLEQELPAISMPLEISADARVSIDGSQISLTRAGQPVRSESFSRAAFGPVRPSQATTARRLVRPGATRFDGDKVSGFVFDSQSSGSSLRNFTLGGFGNNAAIWIDGASNVRIEDVALGRSSSGTRLPNRYGILVDSPVGGSTEFSTINNVIVVNSTEAGIQLNGFSDDVRIVGSQVGLQREGNVRGIVSKGGQQSIGAAPILPAEPLTLAIFPVGNGSRNVTVPVNASTSQISRGVGLRSDSATWSVETIALSADKTRYVLGLQGGVTFPTTSAVNVEVGYFVDAVARSQKLTLPNGFPTEDLFLGQSVSTGLDGIVVDGTVVSEITVVDGRTVITLSNPVRASGRTSVFFGVPERNVVAFNEDGIVLEGGASRIVMTDVTQSVFDGIVVEGVASQGMHSIGGLGGVDGVDLFTGYAMNDPRNVVVTANGLAGIRLTDSLFAGLAGADAKADFVKSHIKIRGNFLGTDVAGSVGLTNGLDGTSNIVFGDQGGDRQNDVAAILLNDPTPGDGPRGTRQDGRYEAMYRPEDARDASGQLIESLVVFVGLDLEGNRHVAGVPVRSIIGGYGDGGIVRLPPRR